MGSFSSSSATLTTILITAEAGSVIKSVRYDKKQRLVKGQHRSLHLRASSPEQAEKWALAIREAMTANG